MKNIFPLFFGAIFISILFPYCIKAPDFSDVPEIKFVSLGKPSLMQGSINNDSMFVTISFTDGDGDIGFTDSTSLFLKDLRTGLESGTYKIPKVPEENTGNGIEGTISFILFTTCCIENETINCCTQPCPNTPTDKLVYEIYLKDRAGNKSNVIQTDPISVICN